ncbi:double-strand break repair helicase AddA [Aquibium microcysteis]|uniref:double-strand break repair helicase AddA n=1 Tax=Aquibium microcysteis TaxID=675281 RepID=UPI00165D0A1D|nr:double-strand break repair helicase AddA [Aquibium microcysteis]
MKKPFFVPEETQRSQARASDPQTSAWVSANAGSGKTHVLSLRVVRLLLDGADPARILCLTYTKAAAANMATRVFRDLGRWATLDDETLSSEIAKIEGGRPSRAKRDLARRLFARALETPGGLKIQTIHAFCEAVLHRFPLEANIAGHFEMLDGQMEQALVAEARRDLLSGASEGRDAVLADAFASVLQAGGEAGLDALLSEIVGKRDRLRAFIDHVGGVSSGFAALFEEFGFSGDETEAAIARTAWPDAYFTAALARTLGERADAAGKAKAAEFAAELAAACGTPDPAAALIAARDLFLKKGKPDWEPKTVKQVLSKGVAEHFPAFADEHARACTALIDACDRLAAFRMLKATRAALTIADWLIARYERLKSARGFLDFNDLITRTVRLLSRADVGPWIQYKLDQGIDHILVDEAQDTSPDQWQVVARLAEEFFTGAGARDNAHRTIFAVGDEKQSIYSFQGAEPRAFGDHGHVFREKVEAAQASFARVRLTHSFRSTEDVLRAVDLVFSGDEARAGLTVDPEGIEHRAIRAGEPGVVELWDQIAPEAVEAPEDWTEPVDHASAPAVQLAETMARTIDGWLKAGEPLPGKGRLVRPGDVLVLVRKRDRFIHALARGLKNRGIPVAGADRLNLRAHIAVKDLIALGRFVLQPNDDLSLAALLKSPVFGRSEDDLYALAHARGRRSLWDVLEGRAATGDPLWRPVADALHRWRDEADGRPVFEFYAAILGRDGVRRAMIARLGHEAGEILDEFLGFCLAAEKAGPAGLESFLAALENAGPDIKREMDQTRDEVRIMTVHASKGLEAPLVFLVDNGSAPFSDTHLPRLLPIPSRKGLWPGDGFVWRSSSDVQNRLSRGIGRAIGEKAKEEYRRLLYVGMTRAEDRLIVCGYRGMREPQEGIWHRLVEAGFSRAAVEEVRHPQTGLRIRRFRITPDRPLAPAEDGAAVQPAPDALPPRLTERLARSRAFPRPLAPSGAGALIGEGEDIGPLSASPVLAAVSGTSFAAARGTAVHRLLQSLPDVTPADREAAAGRYLDRACNGWSAVEREALWQSVDAVLREPAFAPVFSPGSRAEVSVMGTLEVAGRPRAVSGKIDRLAVTGDAVLIVDYKTNRPPPRDLDAVPDTYVAQLALYQALLVPLYPGKRVEAALLFTEGPHLVVLPQTLLDAALVRLTAA